MSAKARIALFGIALFVLGNVSGGGLMRWYGAAQMATVFAPDGLARHRIVQLVLTRRLELTTAQQSTLESILARQDNQYAVARSPCEPAVAQLRADLARELGAYLTAEQNEKLRSILASAETFKP
jgi:hypothetical protein